MRHRSRYLRTIVALALLGTLTLALGPTAQAAELVRASDFRFRPKALDVAKGAKVVWKAVEGSHTVTAYKGRWDKNKVIDAGERTSFTFDRRGTYKYRCRFHSTLVDGVCSGMCGKVIVG